jgi:hypothetical protein
MRNVAKLIWISVPMAIATAGCSGTGGIIPASGEGGANGVGGSNVGGASSSGGGQTGGGSTVQTGGASGGGTTATGGSNAVGGTTTTGGSVSTGGTKSVGGTVSTGGTGTKATGGKSSTGSSQPTGGNPSTGGSHATGGTTSAGGATATGGTKANTGGTGTKATGGNTSSTGGTKATGGASSTGGTTTAGGQASFKCANLSFPLKATGVAKPSAAAGGMKVLNWAGFSSAVSYTFDDSNSSQIKNYPAMKTAGGHYTFYLQTGKSTESSDPVYKTALADGNEMGNHTSDHSNCTSASAIDSANTFIKNTFGVTAYAFAAPNGSSGCNTTSVSSKFLTDRSVAGGQTVSPGDTSKLTWLPADIPSDSASAMGPSAGNWRVFCIHGFTGGNDGAYKPVSISNFTSAVQSAISGGSWVETVTNIAAYNWGQKAIGTNTTSATWTKPSVFPSDMCVRITTSGGTVTQKGAEVPWNDHGYYEISLDAGEVKVQ